MGEVSCIKLYIVTSVCGVGGWGYTCTYMYMHKQPYMHTCTHIHKYAHTCVWYALWQPDPGHWTGPVSELGCLDHDMGDKGNHVTIEELEGGQVWEGLKGWETSSQGWRPDFFRFIRSSKCDWDLLYNRKRELCCLQYFAPRACFPPSLQPQIQEEYISDTVNINILYLFSIHQS